MLSAEHRASDGRLPTVWPKPEPMSSQLRAALNRLNQPAGRSKQIGRRTLRICSDVSDRASLQNLLDECVKEFGKVDILVNSAGRTKREPTLDFAEEDWNAILETNLTGTLRSCQIFGRQMIEQKYGRIINIASLSTFVSLFEVAAYSASKAAVASLTKSLAIEWAKHGVNVNAIAPGVFKTDLNREAFGINRKRQRISDANADGTFRQSRRTRRCGSFFGKGCGKFYHRRSFGR